LKFIGMNTVEPESICLQDITPVEPVIMDSPVIELPQVKQETSITELPIEAITVDTRAQSRAEIDMTLVAEYAELMRDGVIFPPLTVLHDGSTHWLSEGFHRLAAYREAAFLTVPCIVKTGGLREAILLSVGSNSEHGKRRSNADKRRAVELLLKDSEWSAWSDSAISKKCAVDPKTVNSVREAYLRISIDTPSTIAPEPVRTATRNGTTYQVKTAKIGKVKPVAVKPEPEVKPVILAMQPEVAPVVNQPAVMVHTGPVSAMDDPESLPVEKWDYLIQARYRYLAINLPSDCSYLLQFVHEAEQLKMWEKVEHIDMATGDRRPYKGIADFAYNALGLTPARVKWALNGLSMVKSNSPTFDVKSIIHPLPDISIIAGYREGDMPPHELLVLFFEAWFRNDTDREKNGDDYRHLHIMLTEVLPKVEWPKEQFKWWTGKYDVALITKHETFKRLYLDRFGPFFDWSAANLPVNDSTEIDKLKAELAYIKGMVREVYDGTATIRIYGDDDIAFDRN